MSLANDKIYLENALEDINTIKSYTYGLTYEEFIKDDKTYFRINGTFWGIS